MATVKVNPPPPPPQETYTVELSRAEVQGLYNLLLRGVSSSTIVKLSLGNLLVGLQGAFVGHDNEMYFQQLAHLPVSVE